MNMDNNKVAQAIFYACERASCVARSCVSGNASGLLVAEKEGGEANARFDKDYKTIADVVAQESARREVAIRCPGLEANFRGEECAEINGVTIKLMDTEEETAELLSALVPRSDALRMAAAAYQPLEDSLFSTMYLLSLQPDESLQPEDVGIWIDPIDSTAEFIAGVRGEAEPGRGLECVTVLVGGYCKQTGVPIIGAVNQPFYDNGKGRFLWAVAQGNNIKISETMCNGETCAEQKKTKILMMSESEDPELVQEFQNKGWTVKFAPGCGHKLLKVVTGEASAYVLTKNTSFLWDTCAAHALLRSRGGDLVNYNTLVPVTYNVPLNNNVQNYCNSGGFIAYTEAHTLEEIKAVEAIMDI